MVKVLAHFYFKDGSLAEVKTLAQELVSATREEAGCIQYELLQANDDALHFVMQEAWASKEALKAHFETEHFTRIVPLLAGLCTQPPAVEKYTPFV